MSKPGKEFEKLTQRIYQAILDQEGLGTITVEHDVTLTGASGATHQVDVYWEFQHAGVTYETLVSCKDWTDAVPKKEVSDLAGVLEDLRRPAVGIVVSRSGFQEGAVKYAAGSGIKLCTVSEEEGEYVVEILLNLYAPHTSGIEFILDNDWNREEARRRGIDPGTELDIQIQGLTDDIHFLDAEGDAQETLQNVMQHLVPGGHQVVPRTRMEYTFSEERYLDTPDSRMPKIKVSGVAADVEVRHTESTIRVPMGQFAAIIMNDIIEDTTQMLPAEIVNAEQAGEE